MLIGKDLYRQLLRESRHLPDPASATHYRSKIQKAFRKAAVPETSEKGVRRVKEANQLLRQLQAANDGYLHSITRVLETTYGRRGPIKHALLKPFLDQPTTWKGHPDRFSFPPPLASLLLSSKAHMFRPPARDHLINPPTLPPRAFPNSEEARLFGPLTLQRVRKIRQRYWSSQTGKLEAPLAVKVLQDGQEVLNEEAADGVLAEAGLAGVHWKMRNAVLESLEKKVGAADPPRRPRRLQSKEERSTPGPPPNATDLPHPIRMQYHTNRNSKWHLPKRLSPRLLRRQYQAILARSPILFVNKSTAPKDLGKGPLSYRVELSPSAKGERGSIPQASLEDQWWAEQSREVKK